MSSDAIVILRNDHKEMRKLFRAFEKAEKAGDDAMEQKAELVRTIIGELIAHTYIENECMYPATRQLLPEIEDDILESYEEHHVADLLCAELFVMQPSDERFDAKTTVLLEIVEHHMEEEEQEWFPKVRDGVGRKQLAEIGERMLAMKETAPRSPEDPKARKSAADAAGAA
jgi:hemerythrin superfamily protein